MDQQNMSWAQWSASVNNSTITYSDTFQKATLKGTESTIRTAFFKKGIYQLSILYDSGSDNHTHTGIGIVSKKFNIAPGQWIGQNEHSYGTWDNGFHNCGSNICQTQLIKNKDIVSVTLDLNEHTVEFELNGVPYPDTLRFSIPPGEYAFAASLWTINNSVRILQGIKIA